MVPPLLSLLLIITTLPLATAQGCSNTCPPLEGGVPIEDSLCVGDEFSSPSSSYSTCWPIIDGTPESVDFSQLAEDYDIIVVANYFVGCNAGRRESGVFAYSAQHLHDEHPNVMFISSVKGAGSGGCESWSQRYSDFAEDTFDYEVTTMPITISDDTYSIRDTLFTSPFPHPSYVIMDSSLTIRDKFVGPCCGYESYTACSVDTASTLDETLEEKINAVLGDLPERPTAPPTESPTAAPTLSPTASPTEATSSPTASPTHGPVEATEIAWTAGFSDASARLATALVGADVIFTWSGGHNVYSMAGADEYESCSFAGGVDLGGSSPVTWAVPDDAVAGDVYYFGCEVGSHCGAGQKVAITIVDGADGEDGDEDEEDPVDPSPDDEEDEQPDESEDVVGDDEGSAASTRVAIAALSAATLSLLSIA